MNEDGCTLYKQRPSAAIQVIFLDCGSANLLFQVVGKECNCATPGVGGVCGAVAILVVGIFKGVSGIVVNFYFDFFIRLLHCSFEFVNILGRNAAILAAE